MDESTKTLIHNLHSSDKQVQNDAFFAVIALTDQPVDWAYEVWDEMVASLTHKDNHERAIASQVLCNLAKSDPENRILDDFPTLLNVTRDERFVTARHCLQNIWKIGAVGEDQQKVVVDGLTLRYRECINEKNCTLIRSDIIQDFKNLYDVVGDESLREHALALIETEEDLKYRKKYAKIWR